MSVAFFTFSSILAQSCSCIEPSLAFATGTRCPGLYRTVIEFLCIVVWHMSVHSFARCHMVRVWINRRLLRNPVPSGSNKYLCRYTSNLTRSHYRYTHYRYRIIRSFTSYFCIQPCILSQSCIFPQPASSGGYKTSGQDTGMDTEITGV